MVAEPISQTVAGDIGQLRLERLEYGKFCIRSDGPIESGAEHGVLGRSPGFPADVAHWCDPSFLGTVSESFESLPPGCTHGTILRPVLVGGKAVPVLGRVGSRPEDGRSETGRRYSVARYVVSPGTDVGPLALLDALESLPFDGLTRAEVEQGLPPLYAASPAVPRLEEPVLSFLRQAVVFVLSGTPIAVGERVEERLFFEWVTTLWWLLPLRLRPLLSAGWGVGASLSGALTVSWAADIADHAAVYSLIGNAWTSPSRAFAEKAGHWGPVPFQESRLVPGRMYALYAYDWGEGQVSTPDLAVRPEVAMWSRSLPALDLPDLPDFHDRVTVRAFRWPGLKALDVYRLGRLRLWLETGKAEATEADGAFSLVYPEAELEALEAALAALGGQEPERRGRAARFLSRLLARDLAGPVRDTLFSSRRPGAAQMRLIASLVGQTGIPPLEALREVVAAREAQSLPDELSDRLLAVLDEGARPFDGPTIELHARILLSPGRPVVYDRWVRQNALRLFFAFVRWRPPDLDRVLVALGSLGTPAGWTALTRWVLGGLPTAEDASSIASLPGVYGDTFATCLVEEWERPGRDLAARRERVLAWAVCRRPEPAREPLLRFALGAEDLQGDDLIRLAGEVEKGGAPSRLYPRLGVFALREWGVLGPLVRRATEAWMPMTAHWPREVARLLLDSPADAPESEVSPGTEELARDLHLREEAVQALMDLWLPRLPAGGLQTRRLSSWLWPWAAQSLPGAREAGSLVEVVRNLQQGRLTPTAHLSQEAMGRLLRLAREAGAVDGLLERAGELWSSATQLWQIQLLLDLFPEADLQPSARQLEILARQHAWLQDHLIRGRVHPRREDRFRVALLSFHQTRYGAPEWRYDLSATFLWAAFAGVPVAQQGDLAEALEHYARRTRERLDCCRTYLEASDQDRPEAVRRVLQALVVPLLRRRLSDAQIRSLFRRLAKREEPARTRWERLVRALRRLGRRGGRRLRLETVAGGPSSDFLFEVRDRRMILSHSFHAFLLELVQGGAQTVLPQALNDRAVDAER